MDESILIAKWLSILAFASYGVACLVGGHMIEEFERYGLARFRRLTGVLEVLGSLGLLASTSSPWTGAGAAGGLSLLMLLGIATRVRVGDPWHSALPAAFLLVVNLFLALAFARGWSSSSV